MKHPIFSKVVYFTTLTSLVMLPLPHVGLSAPTPASVSRPAKSLTVNATGALWAQNAEFIVNQERKYEYAAQVALLNRIYERNPSQDPITTLAEMNKIRDEFEKRRKSAQGKFSEGDEAAEKVNEFLGAARLIPTLATLLGHPEMAVITAGLDSAPSVVSAAGNSYDDLFGPYQQLNALNSLAEEGESLLKNQGAEWAKAHDRARTNPAFAEVLNAMFSHDFRTNTDSSASEIMRRNPDFFGNRMLRELTAAVGPNGELQIDLELIRKLSEQQTADMKQLLETARENVKTVNSIQQDLKDVARVVKSPAPDTRNEQMEFNAQILGGGVQLLARLTAPIDPKLASSIARTGHASVQVIQSVQGLAKAASSFGKTGLDIGTAMATGNVIGAVMNLVSLFGDAGPTQDQIIQERFDEIRKQIAGLSEEMHGRFDRIDQGLNQIYSDMNTQFAKINQIMVQRLNRVDKSLGQIQETQQAIREELADIKEQLDRIQTQLTQIESKLDRLGMSIHAYHTMQNRLASMERQRSCLTSDRLKQQGGISYEDFVDCSDWFSQFASSGSVATAKNMLNNVDLSDATIFQSSRPASETLVYLTEWAKRSKIASIDFPAGDIAYPEEWASGALALSKVLEDNSDYWALMTDLTPISRVLNTGKHLEDTTQSLFNQSSYSSSLAKSLIAEYENAVSDADALIQSRLKKFETERYRGNSLVSGPFGSIDENALPSKLGPCPGGETLNTTFERPPGVSKVIPSEFWKAYRAGLGAFTMCHTNFSYVNFKEVRSEVPGNVLQTEIRRYNHVRGEIRVYFNNQEVLRSTATSGVPVETYYGLEDLRFEGNFMSPGPNDRLVPFIVREKRTDRTIGLSQRWAGDLALKFFAAPDASTETSIDLNGAKEIGFKVEQLTRDHLARFEQQTRAEMGSPTSELDRALTRISSAKGLLNGFVTIGLPVTAQSNDYVRSLLRGSVGLMDGKKLLERVKTQPVLGASAQFVTESKRTTDLIEKALKPVHLNLQDTPERHKLFSRTRSHLESLRDRVQASIPKQPIGEAIAELRKELNGI